MESFRMVRQTQPPRHARCLEARGRGVQGCCAPEPSSRTGLSGCRARLHDGVLLRPQCTYYSSHGCRPNLPHVLRFLCGSTQAVIAALTPLTCILQRLNRPCMFAREGQTITTATASHLTVPRANRSCMLMHCPSRQRARTPSTVHSRPTCRTAACRERAQVNPAQ